MQSSSSRRAVWILFACLFIAFLAVVISQKL